jgi:hypothetical protein
MRVRAHLINQEDFTKTTATTTTTTKNRGKKWAQHWAF